MNSRRVPGQKNGPEIAQVVERRSHLHDDLERLECAARLLEDADGELADLLRGVIQLSQEHSNLPLLRWLHLAGEEGESFCGEDADVLLTNSTVRGRWETPL
mgnify:CR=1 FL=1